MRRPRGLWPATLASLALLGSVATAGAAPAPSQPAGGPAVASGCAFIFYGAVGQGGAYLGRFREAFAKAGIRNPIVPDYGDPWTVEGLRRLAGEARSVPDRNDLAYAKLLAAQPAMRAAARQSRALGAEQYNLGGYSNGAVMAAAQAYAVAENGGVVAHLVLIGAPLNGDLYDAVRRHPGIRKVITVDLRGAGDPVHAGIGDAAIRGAIPGLAWQFAPKSGHFSLSGTRPEADAARDALARDLVRGGLR